MQRKVTSAALALPPHLRRIAALSTICIVLSFFLYGVFLLGAAAHAAARTEAQEKIRSLSAEVSALEEEYFAHTKTMTLERAKQLGYTKPSEVVIVFAKEKTGALSLRALR